MSNRVKTLTLQIVKTTEALEAALKQDQKNKVRIGNALPRARRIRTTARTLLSKYESVAVVAKKA